MGSFISRLVKVIGDWSTTPARILMLGLDGAGKTTILYRLKLDETISTIPTIGFNVETVTPVPGLELTVWDVGGQTKIRPLWRHYYNGADGLIWIIDSTDKERINESHKELTETLES